MVLFIAGAFVWAPYLPRLVHEGFPAAVWPAPGSFAEVRGATAKAPASAGQPLGVFDQRLQELLAERHATAFLAARNGRVVLEHYAEGLGTETLFNSYSLIKSLVGTLVLKAVSEGKTDGLDVPLGAYLDDIGDAALRAVPIRAFLEMRSGVHFEAGPAKQLSGAPVKDLESAFANPFGPLVRLHMLGLEAVASGLTSDATTRGRLNYQNINTAILGALLERVYGKPLPDILAAKIWQPSGAAPAVWRRYTEDGTVSAYCCLYARARDWVKVATFLSRNGNGAPFLSQDLWREFFGQHFSEAQLRKGQYGLHARHDILDREGEALQGRFTYFLGRGGQIVYMMPERSLVVVRFGEGLQLLHSTLYATWRSLHPGQ